MECIFSLCVRCHISCKINKETGGFLFSGCQHFKEYVGHDSTLSEYWETAGLIKETSISKFTNFARVSLLLGWNLGVYPVANGAPLSTGSQGLLTCIALRWVEGIGFTLFNSLIFNIFSSSPCWQWKGRPSVADWHPTWTSASAQSPSSLFRHPPASPRSRILNYWIRRAPPSTSVADAQLPTGLSKGHNRLDLRPLAGWSYSQKAPAGLLLPCVHLGKQLKKSVCRLWQVRAPRRHIKYRKHLSNNVYTVYVYLFDT